jgi:hypothetical protein
MGKCSINAGIIASGESDKCSGACSSCGLDHAPVTSRQEVTLHLLADNRDANTVFSCKQSIIEVGSAFLLRDNDTRQDRGAEIRRETRRYISLAALLVITR